MTPAEFVEDVLAPGLELLPDAMDTPEARVLLTAICLQESNLTERVQVLSGGRRGAARGLPQFELGGVTGVVRHPTSRYWVAVLCKARQCKFAARDIWAALEHDDLLAVGMARLLLFTDARPLPPVGDAPAAYRYYDRNWRPGKPRPTAWLGNYAKALGATS